MEELAAGMFRCFERGEWAKAEAYFAPGAQIRSQFGKGAPVVLDWAGFYESATNGAVAALGLPVYLDRRVTPLVGDSGFVEQHVTRLNIRGQIVEFPVCLVARCDANGQIELLEEYLDTGLLASAFKKVVSRL